MICVANRCVPPRCGDGRLTGSEKCDDGQNARTELGACNPECSGYYEKKFLRMTSGGGTGNLGGPKGADGLCQNEFGPNWKAMLVGGGRQATKTPYLGDGQVDWVVRKFTHYYSAEDKLVWRTDEVALLGVRDGRRANLYADAWGEAPAGAPYDYPWGGYNTDWTTSPTSDLTGTCLGWTSEAGSGAFPVKDLTFGASNPCTRRMPVLCVEQ
jgi:cysteine-rich repeat protein